MKRHFVYLAATLFLLSACGPNSGAHDGGSNSETPGEVKPKPPTPEAPHDCGSDLPKNCPLFGLSGQELQELRHQLSALPKLNATLLSASKTEMRVLNSALLINYVQSNYKNINISTEQMNFADEVQFFDSVRF